jgi:formylglycine-generating enzyme required for sulfatase activity
MNAKTNIIKSFAVAVATLTAAVCVAGEITVSDVAFAQNSKRDVVITYKLTGSESAVVTVDILTNGVSIGEQNFTRLSGAVNTVVAPSATATNRIYWAATKDWPEHKIDSGVTVKVSARALTNPPDYFVLDLTTGDRKYYNSTNALPDGGLANDIYKTTKLVMRRIPAGGETFLFGWPPDEQSYQANLAFPQHNVSFNDDYYKAIYEMTEGQYATVWPTDNRGSSAGRDSRLPVNLMYYTKLRGTGKSWPTDLHEIADADKASCFIGKIRGVTGDAVQFDLPTEAQWEYACRAGTTTMYYNNITWATRGQLPKILWNQDWVSAQQNVGLLIPNGFGLYDMLGNVFELCLNVWGTGSGVSDGSAAVEPVGPSGTASSYRTIRGGDVTTAKAWCSCSYRYAASGGTSDTKVGFRLVCPAVAR